MPKARRAILAASFDPETLTMLSEVLEEVWAAVTLEFDNDAQTTELERSRLACIILDLAKDRQLGPQQIAQTAARLMRETDVAGDRVRRRTLR
jgi:hypothetical protein